GVRGGAGGGRDGFPLGQTLGILRGVGAGARRPAGGHGHLRPPAVHAHAALQPPLGEEDLDQEKIRELVISMRQQIYAQNEAEVSKRWNFEDGIKRPYFHVKPKSP
ncbi:pre-mRNA-processing factor 39-like, partial [Geospiza fortis]|uniref:Pre-mRNA-processing factor 39-like n=1 Tax=Geospiza fortis TaxID=48883 RepID=A0A8N5F648_GEOFO